MRHAIFTGMCSGLLAVVLSVAGLTAVTHADPTPSQTCPPLCDEIPLSAWPTGGSIPLSSTYHWPDLATVAAPTREPRFGFEEICPTQRADDQGSNADPRGFAVAATSTLEGGPGQWRVQAQILHWRGDTWRGGQWAAATQQVAIAALKNCSAQMSSPGNNPNKVVAVLTGPSVVHQYLLVDVRNSTLVALALSAPSPPPVPWPPISDAEVFAALGTPLCVAYVASCG